MVLAWILALVGTPLAFLILFAAGMKTAPRLELGEVFGAVAVPVLALLAAWAGRTWIPAIIAATGIGLVLFAIVQEPYGRRLRARLRGQSPPAAPPPQHVAIEVGPWCLSLSHRDQEPELPQGFKLVVLREHSPHGEFEFFGGPDVTMLSKQSLLLLGDVGLVSVGGDVLVFDLPGQQQKFRIEPQLRAAKLYHDAQLGDSFLCVGLSGLARIDEHGAILWRQELVNQPGEDAIFGDGTVEYHLTSPRLLRVRLDDGAILQ